MHAFFTFFLEPIRAVLPGAAGAVPSSKTMRSSLRPAMQDEPRSKVRVVCIQNAIFLFIQEEL